MALWNLACQAFLCALRKKFLPATPQRKSLVLDFAAKDELVRRHLGGGLNSLLHKIDETKAPAHKKDLYKSLTRSEAISSLCIERSFPHGPEALRMYLRAYEDGSLPEISSQLALQARAGAFLSCALKRRQCAIHSKFSTSPTVSKHFRLPLLFQKSTCWVFLACHFLGTGQAFDCRSCSLPVLAQLFREDQAIGQTSSL